MSTAAKVVLWVVGSVVTLLLLGAGALWWGLSGGWDGIRPAAQPQDRDVVEAREAGREPLARLAGPVEEELAPGGSGLGTAEVDQCSPGQNNWKTSDGYTLSCSQASVVGATSSGSSVEVVAADVDARLRGLGWAPASYGELEVFASGGNAEGRYERADDPTAVLEVDVVAPGGADPFVSFGRYGPTVVQDDSGEVLEAVSRSPGISVLAVVERT